MATKAAKLTKNNNSERRSGKAWGKDHNSTVKVLSPQAQERKAHRDAERELRRSASSERGSSITMPNITWEWVGSMMAARWPYTRKVHTVDVYLSQGRRNWDDSPVVVEQSPEAKPPKPKVDSRRNGR